MYARVQRKWRTMCFVGEFYRFNIYSTDGLIETVLSIVSEPVLTLSIGCLARSLARSLSLSLSLSRSLSALSLCLSLSLSVGFCLFSLCVSLFLSRSRSLFPCISLAIFFIPMTRNMSHYEPDHASKDDDDSDDD